MLADKRGKTRSRSGGAVLPEDVFLHVFVFSLCVLHRLTPTCVLCLLFLITPMYVFIFCLMLHFLFDASIFIRYAPFSD